jgi:hypothetical protein
MVKLDCFLSLESLIQLGVAFESKILLGARSNHFPISLTQKILGPPKSRPFVLEKYWIDHLDFKENINQWWKEVSLMRGFKMYHL